MKPLVTVITCTFRRPKLLERAIESVRAQTIPRSDYIHMVIEDAENEPSIKDMNLGDDLALYGMEFRTGYPGFAVRNRGAVEADTEFIAFLDDDNWYEPEHLESLLTLQREDCRRGVPGYHAP